LAGAGIALTVAMFWSSRRLASQVLRAYRLATTNQALVDSLGERGRELEEACDALERVSRTDPLTGLANRRVLEAAIERELQAGGDAPCRVAGARLDGGGHALLTAVDRVAGAVDGCGLLAHLGGGELAILLGTTDPDALVARVDAALAAPGTARTAVARPGDTPATLLARLHAPDDRDAHAPAAAQDVPSGITRLLELARRRLAMPVSLRTPGEDDGAAPAGAGVPVRLRSGKVYGMLCAGDTRAHPEPDAGDDQLLRFVAELAAELIDQREEDRAVREVELGTTGVRALLAALEARDFYTSEHSREVVALAIAVARRLGVAEHAVRDIEQVALLHDIGKLGIPDAILQKQGPLDDLQWEIMRQHPVIGERIIADTAGLTHLAPAMRAEHERYDGGGYPDGLAAGAIPLASRITLACDALHAMTSDRPYRPAMTADRARQELRDGAGTQFDPAVVDALLAELSGSR
jgi:HD-GYP domain-containing protein (c-di-GMP phosphodiesterase class II)/GGDEF domain-containing protein